MGAGHPLEDDGMDDDQGRESPGDDALPDDGLDGETLGEDGLDEEAPGETTRPLPADERESVEADLQDLKGMRVVFESQGAKGVVINCTDCGMNHYFGWELLKESLEHMLQTGEPRMHEPAFAPNEEDYIAWDYAKGYLDALGDAGLGGPSRDSTCGPVRGAAPSSSPTTRSAPAAAGRSPWPGSTSSWSSAVSTNATCGSC